MLHRKRFDLRDVVRSTCDDRRPLVEQRGLALRVETSGPVWIDGDPTRIAQVVGNLLDNASKFTSAGGTLSVVIEVHDQRASLHKSGISLALELQPDVVLCDIGLPDMNGYEVARALRNSGRLPATRLVALSGYAQPEDRKRADEAGFEAHLPKPPSFEQLNTLLAGVKS